MLGKCEFYRVVILLSLVACSWGQRFSRRVGDQADEGKCLSLNWGGLTRVHWYTCCNNCESQDTSCDGKTYHGASDGVYCDACGTDNKAGDGKIREDFSCGGCTGQEQILNKCRSKLGILFKTFGFCWAFTRCFEQHCKKQYEQSVTPKDTAFDGVCNEGETAARRSTMHANRMQGLTERARQNAVGNLAAAEPAPELRQCLLSLFFLT